LNMIAPRVMAVLRPVRLTITNLEQDVQLKLPYFPPDVIKDTPDGLVPLPNGRRVKPEQATRAVTLTKDLYIEREDVSANPPPGYKRLTLGGRVRLRGAGVVQCNNIISDDAGNVLEAQCELLGDDAKAGGVIHWVSATHGIPFEARLYDRLFRVPNPEAEAKELEDEEDSTEDRDFLSFLNPNSLEITQGFLEPSVKNDPQNARYQFERNGYFWQDPTDSSQEKLVFNRIISLKDSWAAQAATEIQTKKTGGVKPAASAPQRELELTPAEQTALESFKTKGISEAEALILARDTGLSAYLEQSSIDPSLASSFVIQFGLREGSSVKPAQLAELLQLVSKGQLSRNMAKTVLEKALENNQSPLEIVQKEGLQQVSDSSALEPVVQAVLEANPEKVAAFKGGRVGLLGFFVGEVMKQTKGAANPGMVQDIVKKALEN
jgi:glutaminyl-tRNA synthetase